MPEGHTLRRLADDIDATFGREQVRVTSPQGRFAADAAQLDRQQLVGADSAGKLLFIEFPGERFIYVHLGLIGKFPITLGTPPAQAVGQVRLRLATPSAYADLRGAMVCDLIGVSRRDQLISELGPDPLRLDADPDRGWERVRRSARPIADLLLDQRVTAGVGNIYRTEVLFRHRIHPRRPGKTLRRSHWDAIWADLVELMADGVRVGRIDTVRPEHTPEAMGRPARVDAHGGEVYVYRRAGEPCLVCQRPVRTEVANGRNSFWCAKCQPTFRSRAVR